MWQGVWSLAWPLFFSFEKLNILWTWGKQDKTSMVLHRDKYSLCMHYSAWCSQSEMRFHGANNKQENPTKGQFMGLFYCLGTVAGLWARSHNYSGCCKEKMVGMESKLSRFSPAYLIFAWRQDLGLIVNPYCLKVIQFFKTIQGLLLEIIPLM